MINTRWINSAWVLAITLGLTGASWAVQVTTDHRPPTADRRLLTASEPDATTKATVQAAYSKLPLSFEANQGQSNDQVKFLSHGKGHTLFLTPTEAVLTLRKPEPKAKACPELSRRGKEQRPVLSLVEGAKGKREEQEKTDLAKLETRNSKLATVVRMKLVGANPQAQVTGLDEQPGKSNYFIGNDPKKWRTNIPTYARVQYKDIYPGIDLIFYGNQRQLEHDFVVAPGADPKVIRLAFDGLPPHSVPLPPGERGPMPSVFAPSPLAGEGQDGGRSRSPLQIDDNGDLILHTEGGEIRLHKPHIYYQEINGVKQPIPGGYVLLDLETRDSKLETQKVGFHVAAYDTSKPLVIDPTLFYSTYLGGSGSDAGYGGIAVDDEGNAYVTGLTYSTDFPTASPFQAACRSCSSGYSDAFVTKINATGSALVYSTYLGGSGNDRGYGIAVDASGNAYVTGETDSPGFPTVNPLQPALGGSDDAFVTKINATGSLVYSTYLSGSSNDYGEGIAVDSSGNAYVTGTTGSADDPVTPEYEGFPLANPFQATCGGDCSYGGDAFVTKLNATGSALVYSTYLGGSRYDLGYGIAVDSSGNAYVTGYTDSTDFPTASPLQPAYGGIMYDAFVTKINAIGSALVYSTYLGGSNWDEGRGIAADSSGNAYVTGNTNSTDFPTASPLQAAKGGGLDAFVTKINAIGSALVYSTYLGGNGDERGYGGIAVDSSGNAYVTGNTDSTDFPTASPLQAIYGGGSFDAFVTKLNATGSALVYSTYLGGSYSDEGYGIAADSSGNAYVTGETDSTDFFTVSPIQATLGGNGDAFVVKIVESEVESEYYQVDFEADQGIYSARLIEDSTDYVLTIFDTGELCFGGPGQDYYEGGPSDQKFWLRLEDRPGGGQTMHILSRFANQPVVRVIPCDLGTPQEGRSTLPRPWMGTGDGEPPQEWVDGGGTLGNPIQEPYEQCDLLFAGLVQVYIEDLKGTYRDFKKEVVTPLRTSPQWRKKDVDVDFFSRSGDGYVAGLRVDTRLCRQAVADTIQLIPEETVEDERLLILTDND